MVDQPQKLNIIACKKDSFDDTSKSAQDIQDEVFKKMSAKEKIKLASDFSMFLLKLNKLQTQ